MVSHLTLRRPRPAQSLSALLRSRIVRHAAGDRTAIVHATGSTSYASLGAEIDRWSTSLRGIRRGERVGMLVPRSPDVIALFFGIMQAGGCPCVLEPHLLDRALLPNLAASGMHRVFLDGDVGNVAEKLEDSGVQVSLMGQASLESPRPLEAVHLGRDDVAMMQFTSGSSGQPKGVLLTHGNLLSNAIGVIAHTSLRATDRLLHVMPLHHTNGINNQLIAPFLVGAAVILIDRFRPASIASQIREHRATFMTGVPTMYSRVLAHLPPASDLSSLRFLRCGSAPISAELHQQIESRFGVPLIVSYGLSEATCTSTMNPPSARRIGTIGTALRGQRVSLLAPNSDEEVAAGQEGEICIAGPNVMRGYVGQDADSPVRAGWLRTGDLGRRDVDGYLSITGRLKDIIIRGGENVFPGAIEAVLDQHHDVIACCVVGAPDADLGEVPVAFVQLRPGKTIDPRVLVLAATEQLSRASVPVAVHCVDALPETAVGKVDRQALRRRAATASRGSL